MKEKEAMFTLLLAAATATLSVKGAAALGTIGALAALASSKGRDEKSK